MNEQGQVFVVIRGDDIHQNKRGAQSKCGLFIQSYIEADSSQNTKDDSHQTKRGSQTKCVSFIQSYTEADSSQSTKDDSHQTKFGFFVKLGAVPNWASFMMFFLGLISGTVYPLVFHYIEGRATIHWYYYCRKKCKHQMLS